jgi:hypothetical protein
MQLFGSGTIDVMRNKQIDECIERLCQKGCRSVRDDIRLIEQGETIPELSVLDDLARQAVLKELRSIMAVYGDSCPMPAVDDTPKDGLKHGKKNN